MLASLILGLGGLVVHPGPPVLLQIEVHEGRIELVMVGEQKVIGPWLGVDATWPLGLPLNEDDRAALWAGCEAVFGDQVAPLIIDGVPVRPTVQNVLAFDASLQMFGNEHVLELRLDYATPTEPETIELNWAFFPPDTRGESPSVPFHASSTGGFDYFRLTPKDPSFIWRPHREDALDLMPVTSEPHRPWMRLWIPAVVGGALALLAMARGRRRQAFVTTCAGLVTGALLFGAAGSKPDLPSGEDARELFETLHGRVYAAFGATTESRVYDLLAASVDEGILEGLYTGIRDSLVFREEGGGAICQVDHVEYSDVELLGPPAGELRAAFDVRATWRVDGRVIHFAHEHPRRTRYVATIRVAHDGRAWRIASLQVESQERESFTDQELERMGLSADDADPGSQPTDEDD